MIFNLNNPYEIDKYKEYVKAIQGKGGCRGQEKASQSLFKPKCVLASDP